MGVEHGGERLRETLNALKSPVWLLVVSDKTPSVRTCGLKPSTLKQLGQPIQQPSSTGEVKVRPFPQSGSHLLGGAAGSSENRASIECLKAIGKKPILNTGRTVGGGLA